MRSPTRWLMAVLVCSFPAMPSPAAAERPAYLIRAERRAADDLSRLRAAGFPVVLETSGSLFLEGGDADLIGLGALGYTASILDRDPQGSDYLQIGLRPDSDMEAIDSAGERLWVEENWIIVRVPPASSIEGLADAQAFFARLPHHPVEFRTPPDGAEVGVSGTPGAAAFSPIVQKIVNAVSTASIDGFWSDLVTNPPSGTRFTTSNGCRDAGRYCHDRLEAVRIPAEYQAYSSSNAPNVIGTHVGALTPERVYIVIGHLDDLPPFGLAPGADDNASGTVTVLESARAMSCWAFRSTVKYVACTGEELGLLGSDAYAADALARGEDIRGVLNFDMNGWQGDRIPNPENLDLNFNAESEWLGRLYAQCATDYATGLVVDAFLCPSLTASDHASFWRRGYPAVCGITDNEGYCGHGGNYPYYHKRTDTIAACGNRTFFYSTVRTAVATLATLAEPFKIAFATSEVEAGRSVPLVVGDRGLNADPASVETATVQVWSGTEAAPETVVVTERSVDSMIFEGSVPTGNGPPVAGDGIVSVAVGDTVHARYVDAEDCDGAANVAYDATAVAVASASRPEEVQGVRLDGKTATRVTWAVRPEAAAYDVAGGLLSDLAADGDWGRATCLADALSSNGWDDARPDPPAGDGYDYLVRAVNSAGTGSYGRASDGTERTVDACP